MMDIEDIPKYSFASWFLCETRSFMFREEHSLRVFENRVLRMIFVPKGHEVKGSGEDCIKRSCMICTSY
jgi:hypothetical protein